MMLPLSVAFPLLCVCRNGCFQTRGINYWGCSGHLGVNMDISCTSVILAGPSLHQCARARTPWRCLRVFSAALVMEVWMLHQAWGSNMDVDPWLALTENATARSTGSPSLSPGLVNSSSAAVSVWRDAEQPEERAYRDFAISAQLLILAGSLLGKKTSHHLNILIEKKQ